MGKEHSEGRLSYLIVAATTYQKKKGGWESHATTTSHGCVPCDHLAAFCNNFGFSQF